MTRFFLNRRAVLALSGALLATTTLGTAQAQGGSAAPASGAPLRVILPVSAGSGVDVIVRSAQVALTKALGGQAVVIENLPGAGGITGTQTLVKAPPDGNTVAVISNNHAVNPSVFKKLPYDNLADITPISVLGGSPFVFVVNPAKVPAKNARELQALMKSRPGELNFASSGNGTIIHLAGEMVMDELGVSARHIPYKGTGPMVTDIMSGQVEMGAVAVAAVQGQLAAGSLRPIGVMGRTRVASLPQVPTLAEQGFPGVEIGGWLAVIAPKGLPAAQVQRLHEAFVAAFNDPEVKAGFAKRDDYTILGTPQEAAQFLQSEQARYAQLVKKAKVTLD